jgi:hypothetical protein
VGALISSLLIKFNDDCQSATTATGRLIFDLQQLHSLLGYCVYTRSEVYCKLVMVMIIVMTIFAIMFAEPRPTKIAARTKERSSESSEAILLWCPNSTALFITVYFHVIG